MKKKVLVVSAVVACVLSALVPSTSAYVSSPAPRAYVGTPCARVNKVAANGLTCSPSPFDATQLLWLPVWGARCAKRGQVFWNLKCDYIYASRSREAAGTMEWDVVSIPKIGRTPKGSGSEIAQQFATDVGVIWSLANGKNFVDAKNAYLGGCAGWACSGCHPQIYAMVWRKYAKAKVVVRIPVAKGGVIPDKYSEFCHVLQPGDFWAVVSCAT